MKKFGMRYTPETSRILSKLHPENKKLIRAALEDLRKNPHSSHKQRRRVQTGCPKTSANPLTRTSLKSETPNPKSEIRSKFESPKFK